MLFQDMSKTTSIQAARTTLEVIERLISLDGAGVSELANDLDKPKSTIYDHLHTLTELNYVRRNEDKYVVTTRLLNLGERARQNMDIYQRAKPEVDSLADETGEHASLVTEENGRGVLLHTARGEQAVNVDTHAGMRIRLHTTAPGKAILAYLPEDYVEEIIEENGLPALTKRTIVDRGELFEELERIRNRGYALDREERIEGMHAVAAPILDRKDVVQGALSIYGPSNRITEAGFEDDLPKQVLRAANIVEINLNYR